MEIGLQNDVEFLPVLELIAGDVSVLYEEGHLRYIKYKGHEVIRMIYPAIRDANWNTIPFIIQNEVIEENKNGFVIRYEGIYNSGDIMYETKIEMTVNNDGTVSYEVKGKSLGNFVSKRIGICVLHPIGSCAGREVEIIKPDGGLERSAYPVLISSVQPFTDVAGMKWVDVNNINVELNFEGEVFETEDQRNWTDNSYKTYSGPQYMVGIINVERGDEMRQRVALKVSRYTSNSSVGTGGSSKPLHQPGFPELGFDSDIQPGDHILLSINSKSTEKKDAVGIPVRLNVLFDSFSDEEISSFSKSVTKEIKSILVLSSHDRTVTDRQFANAYQVLKNDHPGISIGYGSSSWFANLNQVLPLNFSCDFLGFTISPQTHLTDNRTILENLSGQHFIMDTIRKYYPDIPVHISVKLSTIPDERINTQFATWWMVNTIANLRDAQSLSFYGVRNNKILEKIHQFKPTSILASSDPHITDPVRYVMQTKIILNNASGEELCLAMKDI